MNGLYWMIYEILGCYHFKHHSFYFSKYVLRVNMFSPLCYLGGSIPSISHKGPYLMLNGPPGKVFESLDNEYSICAYVYFPWKKGSTTFRSIYEFYVLLPEKHRCECADDRSQMRCECLRCVHQWPIPEADTPTQPLRAVGSKEDKTLGPHI